MTSQDKMDSAPDYSEEAFSDDFEDEEILPVFTLEGVWGERLDKVLAQLMPEISRARLQKLIEEGSVEVNGVPASKPRDRVAEGDVVRLLAKPHAGDQMRFEPEEGIDFEVVYEDDAVVVVNKPAGLVVHPGAGNPGGTLMNGLLYRYPELMSVPRAGIVHRLDRDTTGLMVVAKTLAAQTNLVRQLQERTVKRIARIIRTADETFSSFIIGQCTEAVILGTLCSVGMLIFDFPYAVMIGSFIGVTALIPVVGAYLGAGVGAFMILTVDPLKAVLFLIFIVVLQQLEGNLIYPRVVGSSIGLPGMWVLAAVTVGGGLMGIGGMLFGVPLTATLYKLFRSDVNRRNEKKDRWKERAPESKLPPPGNGSREEGKAAAGKSSPERSAASDRRRRTEAGREMSADRRKNNGKER